MEDGQKQPSKLESTPRKCRIGSWPTSALTSSSGGGHIGETHGGHATVVLGDTTSSGAGQELTSKVASSSHGGDIDARMQHRISGLQARLDTLQQNIIQMNASWSMGVHPGHYLHQLINEALAIKQSATSYNSDKQMRHLAHQADVALRSLELCKMGGGIMPGQTAVGTPVMAPTANPPHLYAAHPQVAMPAAMAPGVMPAVPTGYAQQHTYQSVVRCCEPGGYASTQYGYPAVPAISCMPYTQPSPHLVSGMPSPIGIPSPQSLFTSPVGVPAYPQMHTTTVPADGSGGPMYGNGYPSNGMVREGSVQSSFHGEQPSPAGMVEGKKGAGAFGLDGANGIISHGEMVPVNGLGFGGRQAGTDGTMSGSMTVGDDEMSLFVDDRGLDSGLEAPVLDTVLAVDAFGAPVGDLGMVCPEGQYGLGDASVMTSTFVAGVGGIGPAGNEAGSSHGLLGSRLYSEPGPTDNQVAVGYPLVGPWEQNAGLGMEGGAVGDGGGGGSGSGGGLYPPMTATALCNVALYDGGAQVDSHSGMSSMSGHSGGEEKKRRAGMHLGGQGSLTNLSAHTSPSVITNVSGAFVGGGVGDVADRGKRPEPLIIPAGGDMDLLGGPSDGAGDELRRMYCKRRRGILSRCWDLEHSLGAKVFMVVYSDVGPSFLYASPEFQDQTSNEALAPFEERARLHHPIPLEPCRQLSQVRTPEEFETSMVAAFGAQEDRSRSGRTRNRSASFGKQQ